MKCKYCKEEFVANTKGRKRDYCGKADCIRNARNEIQRRWYAKKLKDLKGVKTRIVEQKEDKKIVYCSTDRAINSAKNEDFTEVLELARELGAIRFRINEAINKCSQQQSKFDKNDQVFLHQLEEFAKKDEVYVEEIVQAFKEHIDKRQDRRNVKDKEEMLRHLIQGVISNPNEYVVNFIKDRSKRTYNPKIKEEEVGIEEQ